MLTHKREVKNNNKSKRNTNQFKLEVRIGHSREENDNIDNSIEKSRDLFEKQLAIAFRTGECVFLSNEGREKKRKEMERRMNEEKEEVKRSIKVRTRMLITSKTSSARDRLGSSTRYLPRI